MKKAKKVKAANVENGENTGKKKGGKKKLLLIPVALVLVAALHHFLLLSFDASAPSV